MMCKMPSDSLRSAAPSPGRDIGRAARPPRTLWRQALLCAVWVVALPATAQTLASCQPAMVDMGTLSFASTAASTFCAPTAAPGEPDFSSVYQTSFRFTLAQPVDFLVSVQGTFRFPFPGSSTSGLGIESAALYYGDTFVVSASGRGIGGAEGPALLNPDLAFVPISTSGLEPAGDYEIRVRARGFDPDGLRYDGRINVTVTADGLPEAPVSPVPEPATVAMQAIGIGLLAALFARRRARRQSQPGTRSSGHRRAQPEAEAAAP